jgi:hypothetical protein
MNDNLEKWFNKNIKDNDNYQDVTSDNEIIATVKYDKQYIVEGYDLKFKVDNFIEIFECIIDISRINKKYGKCWELYNKIRKVFSEDEYELYSIYLSAYINHIKINNLLLNELK